MEIEKRYPENYILLGVQRKHTKSWLESIQEDGQRVVIRNPQDYFEKEDGYHLFLRDTGLDSQDPENSLLFRKILFLQMIAERADYFIQKYQDRVMESLSSIGSLSETSILDFEKIAEELSRIN